MAEYRFLTVWQLDAPIEKVWEAILDYKSLPSWWKAVDEVEEIKQGDSTGTGSVCRMVWKTPLAYGVSYQSTVTRVEPPHLLELRTVGDVEGTGRWELSKTEVGTLVHYHWTIRTTKNWMNFLAPLINPLLNWSNDSIMRQGAKGLAQHLNSRLVKVERLDVTG